MGGVGEVQELVYDPRNNFLFFLSKSVGLDGMEAYY